MNSAVRSRRAVFLDRDGTLIEKVHYLTRPDQVRLIPGTGAALRRLREAGFLRVVATNQPMLGKGLMTLDDFAAVHRELDRQLAAEGGAVDAVYHCPTPKGTDDPTVVEFPDRKPGPGMLLRAAADHGLDLPECWMIGDRICDVLAGHNAGCRGLALIHPPGAPPAEAARTTVRFHSFPDVAAAAEFILLGDAG